MRVKGSFSEVPVVLFILQIIFLALIYDQLRRMVKVIEQQT